MSRRQAPPAALARARRHLRGLGLHLPGHPRRGAASCRRSPRPPCASCRGPRDGRHRARRRPPARRPTRRQIADYSLVGVLLLAVRNALVMWAEKRIPSGIAALIVGTVPALADAARRPAPGRPALDAARLGRHADRPRWASRSWRGPEGGVSRPATGGRSSRCRSRRSAWTVGSLYAQSVPEPPAALHASAVEMLAGGARAARRVAGSSARTGRRFATASAPLLGGARLPGGLRLADRRSPPSRTA